jgi:nucleotide-binding universal stress UspA family protein
MYKRVLVAVDGSETAEAILPFIVQLAGPLDLDVILLRASPSTPAVELEAARMISEVYLADLAKGIAGHGLQVETVVRIGAPTETILAVAREKGADLIAMTTHGRTGPSRLLFGSVAEGVLRESLVPVLLLKQSERDLERRRAEGRSR